ncbi:MarR family winged helix-turn-helix transcriptional regulator [Sphingorhabdus sp.]|jgi:DNA-binding MarR family transcriptional regulator|uniref:MarR family winged helix-turn-helix transcriptional regulator n=1 Tax=Sphingorhabdus sp. TaxID=1902408 RepID=UPI002C60088E|nr:MarR family winged helix-turn-helix transcriptional regulator [Sphingorhabdus sp.]HMT40451.1 MarR family winged helix-turn-helix transcriptional regulator [Sphingorhabdus sp.]
MKRLPPISNFVVDKSRFSIGVIDPLKFDSDELNRFARDCGELIQKSYPECEYIIIARTPKTDANCRYQFDVSGYPVNHDSGAVIWKNPPLCSEIGEEQSHHFSNTLVATESWKAISSVSSLSDHLPMNHLSDVSSDDELRELNRISKELSEFAQTLNSITQKENKSIHYSLQERPIGYRHSSTNLARAFVEPKRTDPRIGTDFVRNVIKLRRMRERLLGEDLFADPGWDILLDLFAAQEEGQQVSVSSLCIAAAVPPTTALRWITNMTEAGYLVRRQDPYDARRVYIELSENMAERLKEYFEAIADRVAMPI